MRLSQKLSDFDAEMNNSVPYIESTGTAGRLQISGTKVTSLHDKRELWDPLYDSYKDPLTHAESVKDINDLYDKFHAEIEDLKKQLKSNTDIVLTGTDYSKIHIHVDLDHRHHVEKSTIAPANTCTKITHLVNRFFTFNPTSGQEAVKHLPKDVKKIGRKVVYTNHGEPVPARDKFLLIDAIGTSSYDIVHATENAHKKGYLITWYLNNRGEAGPESDPFPFDTV
ncbi:MAG: hypothetical protein WCL14_06815 [Bacteroidota bacterium]